MVQFDDVVGRSSANINLPCPSSSGEPLRGRPPFCGSSRREVDSSSFRTNSRLPRGRPVCVQTRIARKSWRSPQNAEIHARCGSTIASATVRHPSKRANQQPRSAPQRSTTASFLLTRPIRREASGGVAVEQLELLSRTSCWKWMLGLRLHRVYTRQREMKSSPPFENRKG